jgi:gluconolactonase
MNYSFSKRIFEFSRKLAKNLTGSESSQCLRAKTSNFKSLFQGKARIIRVATGFRFTEGPIWVSKKKWLLFSDIPRNTIFKLSANGQVTVFRNPSGNSNGLTLDGEGRLLACEHGNRRVTRMEHDGSVKVLADTFERKKLNSPNDVVVKSDGSIYFTDPPYGIKPAQQEQLIQGVYRLDPERALLVLIAKDFDRPNGLAFSPDEKTLYIDDSSARRHIRVFDVQPDGRVTNGRLFHDMDIQEKGSPDGMKVDQLGHLYCTGPGGVWVFDPKGQHLGTIVIPEKPANCAWGDDDFRTLYITARTSVYSIRVNIPGMHFN